MPLAPSWVIGEKTHTVAQLRPNEDGQRFEIEITSDAGDAEMRAAKTGTAYDGDLHCPHCHARTPISTLRGDGHDTNGFGNRLRLWTNDDLVPREGDVFGERLYCVRWIETRTVGDRVIEVKHYRSVGEADLQREAKVLALLRERFAEWQAKGFLPSLRIEPGEKTTEPIRTRGWTYWHHLFNPRQLLVLGSFAQAISGNNLPKTSQVFSLLGLGRLTDWNSRLCRFGTGAMRESIAQTFFNQAWLSQLWREIMVFVGAKQRAQRRSNPYMSPLLCPCAAIPV